MGCRLEIGITMNKAQEEAVKNAVIAKEFMLYNYQSLMKRNPSYIVGSGELIGDAVVRIQAQIDELKEPMNA